MVRSWTADFEITEAQAMRLLERQFPALAPVQLELFGIGWDNSAFLVNRRFVFRFPRRQIAAGLIAHEARWLPLLTENLPLPIPVPVFVGQPGEGYPFPFAGYEQIPGTTACRVAWTDAERTRNAVPLARFLAALHRIPVTEETRAQAPGDDILRADLNKRVPMVKERLNNITSLLSGEQVVSLSALIDRLASTPPASEPTCWLHGDLYARHLLVNEARQLCGVIDWGDVHLGDRALDLSIAFSFLPPEARTVFRETYGAIDAATWERARFRALSYGILLVEYGTEVGDDAIRAAGEHALHTTPADLC